MRVYTQLHRVLAACGVAALLVACGEPVAPRGAVPLSAALSSTGITTSFVYDPAVGGSFELASQHRITFAPGAVCDPLVSTYGVTEWDQPCTPLAGPITITARSYTANDRPRVDFSPSLRFVPGSEVVLYLRDKAAAADTTSVLQWCNDANACVTEAAPLPSYVTKRDQALGMVYRAIKHFSGYTISAGRTSLSFDL